MQNVPSGTITFLFTDIEGSTTLWEVHPEAMRAAVARHDAILRNAVESNGGYLFKTTGDGIAAAFAVAPDALKAALYAQRALRAEPWPEFATIVSRMGVHTGVAELRDNDYFGAALSRCARLMGAGHGGQILLSDVAQELCRDHLAARNSLHKLGEYRLKDLTRPETVYQVLDPELIADFPGLRTLDNPEYPNNLPLQVTSFVGRETVIATVRSLLEKTRLLTLTGSGGSGKTRLSLQVAAEVLEEYPDGVYQVELAAMSDPGLVAQTVASVLGVREQIGVPIQHTLVGNLKNRRTLLLLDNTEHVLAASAALVATLTRGCPFLRILVTSREPLAIAGEMTYRLPALTLPTTQQAGNATAATLSQFEAVRLFVDRAIFVKPDFAVTNANAPAVAQLCYRLDGMPLMLELAAARVRSLTVDQINDKLDSRFRLLTGGDRSALPRQQTLRALIDWSYDLLTVAEQALLSRLSVFAGGWTLEAAESVCGFDPIEDFEVLDLLISLIDKSLVVAEEVEFNGRSRYRLLETIREYGREKLEASGRAAMVRLRYWHYFTDLAEMAEPNLAGSQQVRWLDQLEAEHDNLRAALDSCAAAARANAEAVEFGLRIAAALWQFWWVRGYSKEGREHLERTLSARDTAIDASRMSTSATADTVRSSEAETHGAKRVVARAYVAAGTLALRRRDNAAATTLLGDCIQLSRECRDDYTLSEATLGLGYIAGADGDVALANELLRDSLTLSRKLGDRLGIANALGELGNLARSVGYENEARKLFEESLDLRRQIGDKNGMANMLSRLGTMAAARLEFAPARQMTEESLALFREIGNQNGVATVLAELGLIGLKAGEIETARQRFDESVTVLRRIGDRLRLALALSRVGGVAAIQQDYPGARASHAESLSLFSEVDEPRGSITGLEGIASVLVGEGDAHTAAVLSGAAGALRRTVGDPPDDTEQAAIDDMSRKLRAALGESEFIRAHAEGEALPSERAIDLALRSPTVHLP